ncbi:MAG: AraC family transcriptional regulator [Paracoccus sp. (in: a-proteobacteria)]|nr:AraC family transcriptional regulator [Paracoccus sp. (in: a-proteobacteria)]
MPNRFTSEIGGPSIQLRDIAAPLSITETRLPAGMAMMALVLSGGVSVARGMDAPLEIDDAASMAVGAGGLAWFPPGKMGRIRADAGTRASLLMVSEIGLAQALPTGAMSLRLRDMMAEEHLFQLTPDDQAETRRYLGALRDEIARGAPGADAGGDLIRASLLTVLLVRLYRLGHAGQSAAPAPRALIERFARLVAMRRREGWGVADYARELGVSRKQLGRVVQRATGRPPLDFIHRQLHADACDLLSNSRLQISEIAFRLGFSDPAYFTRFFTRLEGVTPGRYRRTRRAKPPAPPESYAIWP